MKTIFDLYEVADSSTNLSICIIWVWSLCYLVFYTTLCFSDFLNICSSMRHSLGNMLKTKVSIVVFICTTWSVCLLLENFHSILSCFLCYSWKLLCHEKLAVFTYLKVLIGFLNQSTESTDEVGCPKKSVQCQKLYSNSNTIFKKIFSVPDSPFSVEKVRFCD